MSKLSFRARALDPSKQMPIYLAEELPDLPEYSAINRAVPQMPSGMEKEEESEHHLQRAICTGLIIPTPEVYTTDQTFYDNSYPPNYKMPRQMIHMQPLGLEQDVPDYDMDSADEAWVNQQSRRLDLTPLKFELMMDRLEKSSGQTVVTLNEAKSLLKQDDEVSIAVYDYWLNKRLKMQHPLILSVKTENRPGASSNNPYLAFRRRTEKMQTRKNRKNDETSYEKMLKLRRDLQRATTMLEMVKRREKTKREQLHLSIDIFEKRVNLRDFSGAILSELSTTLKNTRPAFAPLYTNQYSHHSSSSGSTPTGGLPSGVAAAALGAVLSPGAFLGTGSNTNTGGSHLYSSASQYLNSSSLPLDAHNAAGSRKEKRQYKKRKHKLPRDKQHHHQTQQHQYLAGVGVVPVSSTSAGSASAGGLHSSYSAHHLPHLHHLHRQSSSPAANESNIETEEEEFGIGVGGVGTGGQFAHKLGSESEEEVPFAFRRKQSCDYLRPMAHTGSWPWESKDEHGFGDSKYRYTLTSIRHPKPRCIGFARRRLGRGGRVILDRVSTNLDDFWSQLNYTIFDNASSASHSNELKKESVVKPASPPTVVDLPALTQQFIIPATQIKTEPDESTIPASVAPVSKVDQTESDFVKFNEGYHVNEENNLDAQSNDSNISRVTHFTSAVTLLKRNLRHIRRLRPNIEVSTTKTSKINNVHEAVAENRIPRLLLERLALSWRKLENGEKLPTELGADQVEHTVRRHSSNLNNNNSSSNINKNVSISDKFNVIKLEADDPVSSDATNSTTTTSNSVMLAEGITRTIKQELIAECGSEAASADDSNEPLSSIQKMATSKVDTEILDDEENVNLAQLSSFIRHTVKKEPLDVEAQTPFKTLQDKTTTHFMQAAHSDDDHQANLNCMDDVIRLRHLKREKHIHRQPVNIEIEEEAPPTTEYLGSLSPSSSQRLDMCMDLLSEIRKDWLHFRPKTPTDELLEGTDDFKLPRILDDVGTSTSTLVDWSEQTPISVEMQKICSPSMPANDLDNKLWSSQDNALYVSSSFKYADLEPDAQLLQTAYSPDSTRSSSKSPEAVNATGGGNNSNSGLDFNISGDSLTDINLLGDGDAEDENMLDNILQECQIDDKTLHQATNFWNGILDGEAVDEEVGGDVAAATGLLECIDDKKISTKDAKRSVRKALAARSQRSCTSFGSSCFKTTPKLNGLRTRTFFAKEHLLAPVASTPIKQEVNGEISSAVTPVRIKAEITESEPPRLVASNTPLPASIIPALAVRQPLEADPPPMTSLHHQQPPPSYVNAVAAQSQQSLLSSEVGTAVGDIITLPAATGSQQTQQILQIQQQPQLRTVQQQHRQQQQILLPTSGNFQYMQATGTTVTALRQPTLTPIGASVSGNHMIYTTTSAAGDNTGGPQKIYIQKATSATGNNVPSGGLIALSNIKLETGGSSNCENNASSSPSILTIDSSGSVVGSASTSNTSTPGVNIISTASGQQVAVHSIGNIHLSNVTHLTTANTPLIVTTTSTANRNTQQLVQNQEQQQDEQQKQQQIFLANHLSAMAAGNKIVWASRPGEKRQQNGPEALTDINKLLLNRKFAQQRKIVSQVTNQHQQQHQFQITKQHFQQLQQLQQLQQQQQQEDDNPNSSEASASTVVQQQQLQKIQSKVIKMSSIPSILVSELQQQSQQQQKHNSAATVAANHNYSLQPTAAIITSQSSSGQQQSGTVTGVGGGNKIYLTSAGGVTGAGTNFTIATARELQAVAAAAASGQTGQKIQYKELPNCNLKFVASTVSGGQTGTDNSAISSQQSQAQPQQQVGTTTALLLNKATASNLQQVQHQQQQLQQQYQQQQLPQQMQQLQQKQFMQRDRILNIIGATKNATSSNSATGETGNTLSIATSKPGTDANNKRFVYTSLLNMKPLQNTGQMQMQIRPGGVTHTVLRGRIANNQTIFTNMRTLPTTSAGITAAVVPASTSVTVTANSNNNNNSSEINSASSSNDQAVTTTNSKNTSGLLENVNASGGGVSGINNATVTATNATATTTINR